MNKPIIITSDGSCTLFSPKFNEHYHSKHGAVQESRHVFIEAGLNHCKGNPISIFEMGFGTGLNALLTLLGSSAQKNIRYSAIEQFPLSPQSIIHLNYPQFLALDKTETELFQQMHNCSWNDWQKITPYFQIKKEDVDLLNFNTTDRFDLVYFDAFSPQIQPQLWDYPIWLKLYGLMNKGAVLVTYCAKGSVRRALQNTGFFVERLPGPPGKHEMLRVTK